MSLSKRTFSYIYLFRKVSSLLKWLLSGYFYITFLAINYCTFLKWLLIVTHMNIYVSFFFFKRASCNFYLMYVFYAIFGCFLWSLLLLVTCLSNFWHALYCVTFWWYFRLIFCDLGIVDAHKFNLSLILSPADTRAVEIHRITVFFFLALSDIFHTKGIIMDTKLRALHERDAVIFFNLLQLV